MRIAAASPRGAPRAQRIDAGAQRADDAGSQHTGDTVVPRTDDACAPRTVDASVRVATLAALDRVVRSRGSVTARSALSCTTRRAVAFR
jgi:hypothetical protein